MSKLLLPNTAWSPVKPFCTLPLTALIPTTTTRPGLSVGSSGLTQVIQPQDTQLIVGNIFIERLIYGTQTVSA